MKITSVLAITAALFCIALPAIADTTVKSTVENKGMGGVMDMQGTHELLISGDKSKTVSEMKMTNKVMKLMGGGKLQRTAEITRLDKELFWDIDFKEKEYTELTFADMKAMFAKGAQEVQKEKAKQGKSDADSVKFTTEVKIDKTGKVKTIAGYSASEVIVTMLFTGTDTTSGKSETMKMEMDLWLAKDVPGYQEYQNYQRSLGEKLGMNNQQKGGMEQALKGFGVDPKVVYEKTKDIEGMPLLSIVTIQPEGLDSVFAQMEDSLKKAEAEDKAQAKEAEKPSNPTDLKGKGLKKLGGLFGKKKDAKKEEAAPAEGDGGKSPYLFHMTTTVTSITADPIPSAEFEVPQGFRKATK